MYNNMNKGKWISHHMNRKAPTLQGGILQNAMPTFKFITNKFSLPCFPRWFAYNLWLDIYIIHVSC